MIGYLKGVISHIFVNSCFIDVHGVGYRTYAPASTLDTLCVGQEAMLYTYMSVREDAIVLYGFATQDEYDLFMLLIGVNGVGPKWPWASSAPARPTVSAWPSIKRTSRA